MGYYVSTSSSSVAVGQNLPISATVRQFGRNISMINNAVVLSGGCGCANSAGVAFYDVDASVSLVAGAAGVLTVSLYQDGAAVPGATASTTVASGATANLDISAAVKTLNNVNSTLTLVVSGVAVTTQNVAIRVARS